MSARKNLADSVLARAELFRRGMLFDGVPSFTPPPAMPAPPAGDTAGSSPGLPAEGGAGAPVEGATDSIVAGAVEGAPLLETMLQPQGQP